MKITKEAAFAAMVRFVRENGRYPTKEEFKTTDYMSSAETSRRLIGSLKDLTILEDMYNEEPKRCAYCASPIAFEKRKTHSFCSHACFSKSRIIPQEDKKANYSYKRYVDCQGCGVTLQNNSTKYCTLQCQQDTATRKRLELWKDGKHYENRVIRRFLEILHGYNCSVCGVTDWNGKPITLEVEHKDGNSDDSSPENVCLICPNCHSQTDTYKGKNRGNGRHWRTQRYHEGKSY